MVPRLRVKSEKKLPNLSISIEKIYSDDFKLACANNNTYPSREIRSFIISYIDKEKEKDEKK